MRTSPLATVNRGGAFTMPLWEGAVTRRGMPSGVRYRLADNSSLYASLGKASREPTRSDLLLGEDNATVAHDLEAVRPERVVDLEAGYDLRTARVSLAANLYAMEFRNEIAATGELSEIGLPLRRNVERSFRRGFELDLRWTAAPRWTVTLAAWLLRPGTSTRLAMALARAGRNSVAAARASGSPIIAAYT